MSKSIVINLGQGDLHCGFPSVTVQLWVSGHPLPEQFIGNLPPAPDLVEICRSWQSIYQNICDRKSWRSPSADDDELEIDDGAVTNVSVLDFDELCQHLQQRMNEWLKSEGILNISRQLRSALNPIEEIRVIVETNNKLLRQLPWHRSDFFQDYPFAEVALSRPEYKRAHSLQQKISREKVRILAILGNSFGIDLKTESQFLDRLPDAEVVFLVKPSRQEFNTHLWDSIGWDILFFAGHSQTEGETGRIYINENKTNNSLTIEQLEEALKAAIEKGLKLAIFNSCDGLGLAFALEKLNIPTVIVMREPVPNLVAQEFFKHFLDAFAIERRSLYISVQQARRKLQGLEDDLPGASWLPVICQNPAVKSPNWLNLAGTPPCPYRGLFAFREEDAHLFFGREQFTENLVTAVKKKPFVAVVGSSGSGKSSVVFAGLIPRLRQDTNIQWLLISFRPGNNPIAALAAAFAPLLSQNNSGGVGGTATLKIQQTGGTPILQQLKIQQTGGTPIPQQLKIQQTGETPIPQQLKIQQTGGTPIPQQLKIQQTGGTPIPQQNEIPNANNLQRLVELELELEFKQDNKALYKVIETFVQETPGTRLVLIADQFEELYTLCSEKERQHFLDLLLNACSSAPGFTLLATLRADFYGYALSYRPLSDALQGAILNLGPMSRQELRNCIEKPAEYMQVELEKELTNKVIYALEGQPGRLPLLEFTLTQLWSRQTEGLLTYKDYEELGGVEEALANHAEQVYSQLSETDRLRSQRVFMQLIRLGEAGEVTRRLATRDEVKEENWDLVTHLASERLVVTNRNESTKSETVEIVHEALIKSWGRLEHWLQSDGEFRRWQEQLRLAIRQWESSNKDEGVLLRGKPLCDAEYWQNERSLELSFSEQSFIQSSIELRERQLKEQKRRQQTTIIGLTSGMAIALILALVAFWQWQKARINEIQATSTYSEALFASNYKLEALVEALRAQLKLKMVGTAPIETKTQVELALRQAVYGQQEHNRLLGHNNFIWDVAFSPNNQLIATASNDKTVKIWKQDGTLLTTLKDHSEAVSGVAFSPDGQTIASGSRDKTLKLWKTDGTLLKTFKGHYSEIYSVAFSPDGQIIASGSGDKTVKLWTRDGNLVTTLNGHKDTVSAIAFRPDGQEIATSSWDNTVKLWRRDGTLVTTLNGHKNKVSGVAFSPNGQTLATASWDTTVKLWNTSNGNLLNTLGNTGSNRSQVYGVAFSPDGRTIASANWDGTVKLWNPSNGNLLTTLSGHKTFVSKVTFSPDGQTIASASKDKTVKLWKLNNSLLTFLHGHTAPVYTIAIRAQGNLIATGGKDNTVKLWKRDGTFKTSLKGHNDTVWGVAFSSDGQTIASVSEDKTVKLWNTKGILLRTLKGHSDAVQSVAFSADGRTIASSSDDMTVKLWKLDGTLIKTFWDHNQEVWGVAFSPDGEMIASADRDGVVKLWSPDGTVMRTLSGHKDDGRAIAFSPDSQLIATGSQDHTIKLWNRDGKLLTTLIGHSGAVWGVAFSPDGKTIASSSDDKTVKLWNTNGKLLVTLNGAHSGTVWGITFSSDGKTIASVSEDTTVILWNLEHAISLDRLLNYSCDWVSDYLKTNAQMRNKFDETPVLEVRHLCAGIKSQ